MDLLHRQFLPSPSTPDSCQYPGPYWFPQQPKLSLRTPSHINLRNQEGMGNRYVCVGMVPHTCCHSPGRNQRLPPHIHGKTSHVKQLRAWHLHHPALPNLLLSSSFSPLRVTSLWPSLRGWDGGHGQPIPTFNSAQLCGPSAGIPPRN